MYCAKCKITAEDEHVYCHRCGGALVAEESSVASEPSGRDADVNEILSIKLRLADIEARLPMSNVVSKRFWPRAFAVYGHVLAAHLAVVGVILAVALVFAAVISMIELLHR